MTENWFISRPNQKSDLAWQNSKLLYKLKFELYDSRLTHLSKP